MPPSNRASWLMAKQSPVNVVDSAPYTPPSTNELVIKTKAIALNPADVAVQKLGIILKEYPAILGCDVAGEVVEVHPSLSDIYSIGDRVIGAASCMDRKDGVYCYSGFQEYVVLKAPSIARIPREVACEDAVVLPLGMTTAASCLFMEETLRLRTPSIDGTKVTQGKTLLVWGASGSVGSCAVQMATHAGYEVVGVASKRNHGMVESLGASVCFDQTDTNLVDKIVAYLDGREVVGAFDAISNESTLNTICEIIGRSGGRKLVASVMPGAEAKATNGVQIVTNFVANLASREILKDTVWQWLNKAMEECNVRYMPQSEVVGKGLEDVQKGVDLLAKGVSAKKLVLSI
jgi:NADPH:quinone reductase-like Zn-dependent oxidoreductase